MLIPVDLLKFDYSTEFFLSNETFVDLTDFDYYKMNKSKVMTKTLLKINKTIGNVKQGKKTVKVYIWN